MKKRILGTLVICLMISLAFTPLSYATGGKQAAASLLLPTTGQAMNGQLGNSKTKIMAGIEVASITALAIVGGVVGGPAIWCAAGPLIANHVWSATDAYMTAKKEGGLDYRQQMTDAQRSLEFSRQSRFDREQTDRSDIRDRIKRAGEMAAV